MREVLTWANYNNESEQRQAAWQLVSSAGKYNDERKRESNFRRTEQTFYT